MNKQQSHTTIWHQRAEARESGIWYEGKEIACKKKGRKEFEIWENKKDREKLHKKELKVKICKV